ncbi:MAG: sugar phosphate isomerase/epimerase [Candidatus Hydrogenedentales bacterium]|jgi:sugar phosphate isomerase/epimerase
MATLPFALQLYTVRDHMDTDIPGTLKRVKEIGYDNVELAGLGPYTAEEYSYFLADAGLTAISAHFGFNEVVHETAMVAEAGDALGLAFIVMPWLGGELCPDMDAWVANIAALDQSGASLREMGITLCYHNHAHEFERINGKCIFDQIFDTASPENLSAELDTYWAKFGGADPVSTIKKYTGRCPLIHVKDMEAEEPRSFTELGRGIMDWKSIFAAARHADVRWYIVEQDVCKGDSLESARIGAEFMRHQ